MTAEEILKIFDLKPRDGQMIVIGIFVFFVFWRIVEKLIFNPFLTLFEEREALTSGAHESSKQLLDEARAISTRCDEDLHRARVSAIAEKLQVLTAAKVQATKISEEAENEVQEMVRKARWEREQNLSQTKQKVMSDADALAQQVVQKLTSSGAASS